MLITLQLYFMVIYVHEYWLNNEAPAKNTTELR